MARGTAFYNIPPSDWLFKGHGDVVAASNRAEEYFQKKGTYAGAEKSIEEFVRQWVLKLLFVEYSYPEEWIGERIVIEHQVKMGSTEKEADIAITNAQNRPFLYIETKSYGTSEKAFKEAERQLESYLASTHTATIGMITDGINTKVIRKKIDPNEFDYVPDFPSYGLPTKNRFQLVREISKETNARLTGLQLLDQNYEQVLFECHSAARDVDGLHADEALDEICKVLYAKIYDERQTTKSKEGTPFRFQSYGASNDSEVASVIRTIYEEAKTADFEIYSKRIPEYERSRGVFKAPIKLSDSALYQIVESLQDFSLIDSKADIKGRAFQKILAPAIRAGMGQYFTPDPIVEIAIGAINPQPTDLILDPFCGSGHFLSRALDHIMNHNQDRMTEHDLHEFKFFHLHGIEKSDRMVRIAMTDMMLHDDGHTNIRNQDALLSFDNYPDIISMGDNIAKSDPGVFSVILTNPPFGSLMKKETMNYLGRFELGRKKKSLPLEVLGLERSIQFLKPGGKIAIVLPEHLMKGKTGLYVREWLETQVKLKAVFFFPEAAFTPYGAMVKTCLCIMQKLKSGEVATDKDSVLLCDVENLGYEPTGKLKAGSEVLAAIEAFQKNVIWS